MKPKSKLTRLLSARARSRRHSGGAALVEAAVAIPVMLAFLGLTMFIHNTYDEKLASQTSTRAQVLYYASHNCDGNVPEEMSVQLGTKTSGMKTGAAPNEAEPGSGPNPGTGPAEKLGGDTQSALKRGWNLANTSRSTTVGGSAVQVQKKVAFSAPVTSNSEAACNEKRFDNNWTAVFGYIKGFIKSGGGIID